MKKILVAGGAGYIGSHVCIELLKAGYFPVIFDNFENSYPEVVARLQQQAEAIRTELGDVRVMGTDQHPINLTDPQER